MAPRIPVEENIISEAEFGLFFLRAVITKKKAKELEKEGFEVFVYAPRNRLYYIRWTNSIVECEDVNLLDENSDEYNLSQKAWIIAKKTRKSPLNYLNSKEENMKKQV